MRNLYEVLSILAGEPIILPESMLRDYVFTNFQKLVENEENYSPHVDWQCIHADILYRQINMVDPAFSYDVQEGESFESVNPLFWKLGILRQIKNLFPTSESFEGHTHLERILLGILLNINLVIIYVTKSNHFGKYVFILPNNNHQVGMCPFTYVYEYQSKNKFLYKFNHPYETNPSQLARLERQTTNFMEKMIKESIEGHHTWMTHFSKHKLSTGQRVIIGAQVQPKPAFSHPSNEGTCLQFRSSVYKFLDSFLGWH